MQSHLALFQISKYRENTYNPINSSKKELINYQDDNNSQIGNDINLDQLLIYNDVDNYINNDKNNLKQNLISNDYNTNMENTIYGTGLIPKKHRSKKCWKVFLEKINKKNNNSCTTADI
jgi:hypothetical protein